jgi:NAD(P)-dependent dehydrogenase (short-subunit alcohol dehydrogenase family)
MTKRLQDRITLITGGTGQLGREVVRAFIAEGARVHVPVFAPDERDRLKDHLGDAVAAVHFHDDGDLTDPQRVGQILEAVREEAGRRVEVLLNLAGGFFMAPVEETGPEDWEGMWRRNATTAFLCARGVIPGMRERGWGRIVNVSAHPALDRGQSGLSAYGAAKAAVLNLTQTLAKEVVTDGITVNAVLPSIIDTPENRESMPEADTSAWIPPSEVAGVMAFLSSDEARTLNGAALTLTLG